MRMRRASSHPAFKLEGRSRHFQACWEIELTPGERTSPHCHYESEELIYLVAGKGTVRVAEDERRLVPGEVVLVPPSTDHSIANPFDHVLRAITVESRLGVGEPESTEFPAGSEVVAQAQAEEAAQRSATNVDEVLGALPGQVDEAAAIQSIVELFHIGGQLTEEIEATHGLQTGGGLAALAGVERKIMRAVLEISARYQLSNPDRGWLLG
jgi:mannose-6-phosphate isomerase-like protein (cupin superfamily)